MKFLRNIIRHLRKWLIPFFAVATIVFCVISWSKNFIALDAHCYVSILLISVITFLFSFGRAINRINFTHNIISPFWATSKSKTASLVLGFLTIVPILYFLIHKVSNSSVEFEAYLNPWGIWISFMGVIITLRIFLEIKNKNKHDFQEFVSVLVEFINSSRQNDEIYLILPTLFIGAVGHKGFHKRFRLKILELAKNKKKHFHVALFDYDKESIQEFVNSIDSKDFTEFSDDEKSNYHSKLNQAKSASLLFKFHLTWNNKFIYGENERKNFFKELSLFMLELDKLAEDTDYLFTIDKIKKDYFINEGQVALGNEGLFLFTNITQKIFYLGNISINAQEDIVFQNSIILGVPIDKEFKTIYKTFVNERC